MAQETHIPPFEIINGQPNFGHSFMSALRGGSQATNRLRSLDQLSQKDRKKGVPMPFQIP